MSSPLRMEPPMGEGQMTRRGKTGTHGRDRMGRIIRGNAMVVTVPMTDHLVCLVCSSASNFAGSAHSVVAQPARWLRQRCEAGARSHSIMCMFYLALPHSPLDEAPSNHRPMVRQGTAPAFGPAQRVEKLMIKIGTLQIPVDSLLPHTQ